MNPAALTNKLTWRAKFVLGDNPFAMRERLRFVTNAKSIATPKRLLAHALRTDHEGAEYFHVAGQRWYFDPDYPVTDREALREAARLVLLESFVEPEPLLTPDITPPPHGVVIDAGANIGTTARLFTQALASDGRVFAFEPVTAGAARKNLQQNLKPHRATVELVPLGLADREGHADIHIGDHAIDSSIAHGAAASVHDAQTFDDHSRTIAIQLTTIDAFVRQRRLDRLDLIKLDIEGAEELAILGADDTIKRFAPAFTIASYHTDHRGQLQHDCLRRLLHDRGYLTEEVRRDGRGLRIYAHKPT